MSCINIVYFCLFVAVFLYFATEKVDSFDVATDGHRSKEASPMWFGPRMGRKKRNPGDKVYRNDKKQSQSALLDILRESPLVVVAVNEGKAHNFIPRLGRESGEELADWLQETQFLDDDTLSSRSTNPFAPRLGRNNNYSPFSPRLGRDNSPYTEYLDGEALSSRSTNPFAPRLGRNNFSSFSPRLGRDIETPSK